MFGRKGNDEHAFSYSNFTERGDEISSTTLSDRKRDICSCLNMLKTK